MPQITREDVRVPADVMPETVELYIDNYMAATRGTGRLMLFACDQKIEHLNKDFHGEGIDPADGDPEHLFQIGDQGTIGVLAGQRGLIAQYARDYPNINYLVKMNSKTNLVKTAQQDPYSPQLYDLEAVLAMREAGVNIVGLGYTIYLGSEYEANMLAEAGELIAEAHAEGLLVVLWIYPRGEAVTDEKAADLIAANYFEVVAAPDFEEGVLEKLAARKNLRIFKLPALARLGELAGVPFLDVKSMADGGIILQQSFVNRIRSAADFIPAVATTKDGLTVSARKPTPQEADDLVFAWAVEAGVTSNSVIFAHNGATVAIGTGEQDRVGCVELAIFKAYTKYADTLAFTRHGMTLYELKLKAKEDAEAAEQLAASVLYMDDPEKKEQNITMSELSPKRLLMGDTPRLIDEWQLAPKLWDAIRFEVDHRGELGQFILTGSAVPADTKKITHSGTGRFTWLTMRPMSLYESGDSTGEVSLKALFDGTAEIDGASNLSIERLAFLVCRGGWPQAVDMRDEIALD